MLEALRTNNPEIPFFSVSDPEFLEYGRVINDLDATEIIEVAKKIELPEGCSKYMPSVPEFEALSVAEEIMDRFFGELPTQIGYTYGHSQKMNALEWHTSSEINIAVTPLMVLLAKRCEIVDGVIDSSKVKAFYVPQGTVLECYATTLHFCPCEATKGGFGWVVALPKGTNLPLDKKPLDMLLFKKNKWLIAHSEHTAALQQGAKLGITGKNLVICPVND